MSRRTWLLLFLALVLLAATAYGGTRWIKVDGTITSRTPQVVIDKSNVSTFSFRVHFPGFQIDELEAEGQIWNRVTFNRMSQHGFPGEPEVPVLSRWIAVPDGADPVVKVSASGVRKVNGINHIPAQAPAPDCYCEDDPAFERDASIYDSNDTFPGTLYKLEEPIVVRGLRLARLNLYPVQVLPATEQALIYSDFEVNVQFRGGKGKFFTDRRGESFQRIYDLAMNHMAFANEPKPAMRGKSANGAEYLIICGPNFADAAQDLAEWKILQGYDTEVYTTNETGTSVAAIKAFIQDAYDNWDPAPEWILFIGDSEFISPTYDGYNASDLYYLTVDGSDYWEDIHSGRLSIETADQAQKRVNDIIKYERDPVDNDTYYTNAWFAAYFQHLGGGEEERRFLRTTEEEYRWFNEYMPNSPFTPHRIYVTESYVNPKYWNQSTYNWTPDWWTYGSYQIPTDIQRPNLAWDGDAADITAAISAGTVFVTHRDHGEETGWADPAYYVSNVNGLNNGDMLPTIWSINCLTGDFDSSSDPCFSESWERNENGGAVGIMASTELSYSGTNDRMFWGWLDSMWPDYVPGYPDTKANDPEWRQALVMLYGKVFNLWMREDDPYALTAIEEFHYFGDPTQEMYAGVPSEFSPNYMPVVPLGSSTYDVEVGVAGARVALVQEGVILGKAYSDAVGQAHIVFDEPLTSTGSIHLTITRYQYRAYEADLLAGATEDGIVRLDAAGYSEDDTIGVLLSDSGLTGQGTYTLKIDSTLETSGEDVVLTEIESTGTFEGSIETTSDAPSADGMLSVNNAGTITVYYHDANNGSTGAEDKTDTAYSDTAAPDFDGAENADGGDQKVVLTWNAANDMTAPITYQIYRREEGGSFNYNEPIGETKALTYTDSGLPNFVTYYYVVRATDGFGHQDTNTAEVFTTTVGPIGFWWEDFDDVSEAGIPDDWQIENGQATDCTWSDENPGGRSNTNWDGVFIIADAGACGGTFTKWDDKIISESINPFGYTDVRLVFTHYYVPGNGIFPTHGIVSVSNDGGTTWNAVANFASDEEEGVVDLDISEFADNVTDLRLAFTYTSGGNGEYWGIDNIELRGVPDVDPPAADFVANKTQGKVPLTVTFTPDTTGVISAYEWDFGDGQTSTEQFPTHTYNTSGTFDVTLEVTGPHGTDSVTKEAYITANCPDPAVNFEADVTEGEVPLDVAFTDVTDYVGDCGATSVLWDFGDGQTSTESDPVHTYAAPGVYTVKLTYTTDFGAGTYQKVRAAYIKTECGLPVVAFTADVTEGEAPLTVNFTDQSTAAAGCEINGWQWGFGQYLDELELVNEQNPSFTFTEPGIYHVVLRATNAAGTAELVESGYIEVLEAGDDDVSDDDATDDDNGGSDSGDDDDDSGCGC